MPPVRRPRPQPVKPEKTAKGSNNITTIIIIIIILIACGVGGYFLYPVVKNELEKRNRQELPPPPVQEVVQDTVPQVTETVPVEDIKPDKRESSPSVDRGFYIIVGSFQNKNYAESMVRRLKKDVDLTVLHFPELGVYRVSAGKYESIHKAYNDKYSIKDIDGCENAWVLENI